MYANSTPSAVSIQLRQDLLFIELNDFINEAIFTVQDEQNKTVRKGKFKGNSVQLTLMHLPSGRYRLGLNHLEEVIDYFFEKREDRYIVSGMHVSNSTAS